MSACSLTVLCFPAFTTAQGLEDSLIQKFVALIPALMQEKPKCQGGNSSGHCIEIDELEASIDRIVSLHAEKEKTVFSRI
jgi:hypothetical protein